MTDTRTLEALRGSMAGQIITPGDAAYDETRQVFNAMHDRRPAVIARCRTTTDVVAAVNFARETRLLVAVRSGGHSVSGLSVCDDGMLIDLGGLKDIQVDPVARKARPEPVAGTTTRQLVEHMARGLLVLPEHRSPHPCS